LVVGAGATLTVVVGAGVDTTIGVIGAGVGIVVCVVAPPDVVLIVDTGAGVGTAITEVAPGVATVALTGCFHQVAASAITTIIATTIIAYPGMAFL
jgi:hypothetical protein